MLYDNLGQKMCVLIQGCFTLSNCSPLSCLRTTVGREGGREGRREEVSFDLKVEIMLSIHL